MIERPGGDALFAMKFKSSTKSHQRRQFWAATHRAVWIGMGLLVGLTGTSQAAGIKVKSPNGNVVATFTAGERLSYAVNFRGQKALELSALGITVAGIDLGGKVAFAGRLETTTFKEAYPTLGGRAVAVNHYRVTVIPLRSRGVDWQIEVRAYDDGIAYRYRVPGAGQRRIGGESSEWRLPVGTKFWHQSSANRSYEARYVPDIAGQSSTGHRSMAPMALKFSGGLGYGLVTEATLPQRTVSSSATAQTR